MEGRLRRKDDGEDPAPVSERLGTWKEAGVLYTPRMWKKKQNMGGATERGLLWVGTWGAGANEMDVL